MNEQEIEALRKVFLAARDNVLNKIINTGGLGTKAYYNAILKVIETEFKKLQAASLNFIDMAVPAEYQRGLEDIYKVFEANGVMMDAPNLFAGVHTEAVYQLVREMRYQMNQGIAQAGKRLVNQVIDSRSELLRQTSLETAAEKLASGTTINDMRKSLVGKLESEGYMAVQYGSGPDAYQVPLDHYATLCARTIPLQAGNQARENQLTENGYDLVEMTTHYPTCAICAQYQGRIYSISGNDQRFPPLSKPFSGGYHGIHPQCTHTVVPFIESLQTDGEMRQAIERSNKPFVDNRSMREISEYNQGQAKVRQSRQDLYQYERYKQILGEDAPKSYRSFQALKKTAGEKWDFMQVDFHRRNDLNLHPETALPNAVAASAADKKFMEYLFNPSSKQGWPKGIAISNRLGYNIDNWQEMRAEILKKAPQYPVKLRASDEHGERYEQQVILQGKKGTPTNVLIGWLVNQDKTHLSTLYIKEVKKQ